MDEPGIGSDMIGPFDTYDLTRLQDPWDERRRASLAAALAQCKEHPLISVLMPVYEPHIPHLAAAVQSLTDQVYPNWELCIAVDGEASAQLRAALAEWSADLRVKHEVRQSRGHISAATNTAAGLASGAFFVLLDQDDLLTPDALARCVMVHDADRDLDYIYSDSDKIDMEGRHYAVDRKASFSPELLLGRMCVGQLICVSARLWHELGGMREGFEGSQDYDFALRATELARAVGHVPDVLYHWRAAPGSTALDARAKPYSFEAGARAVSEALERRGVRGMISRSRWAQDNGVGIFEIDFPDDGPRVGIVIPTRNRLDLLRRCLGSLEATRYRNFEVVVVDDTSDDPETIAYLASLPDLCSFPVRVMPVSGSDRRFNFSRLVNTAVASLETEFVLLLNNDTEVIAPDWLSTLAGYGALPGVGAVGALLLYPDNRVQHAGVFFEGTPPHHVGHLYKGASESEIAVMPAYNVEAVTAACMLVRRKSFVELGGFDEESFGVAYNDVDFCIRLRRTGGRIVVAPRAKLFHHEGASRGHVDNPAELAALVRMHGRLSDCYRNPHLGRGENPKAVPRRLSRDGEPGFRVLAVTHNLNREGAPLALLEACQHIRQAFGVDIRLQSQLDGELRKDYLQAGIPVDVVPAPWAGSATPTRYEDMTYLAAQDYLDHGVDLVLANTLVSFHAVDAAHSAGIPSLWWLHENDGLEAHFSGLAPEIYLRAQACFGHPYRVIYVSSATQQVYEHFDFHKNALTIPGSLPAEWARDALNLPPPEVRVSLGISPDAVVALSLGTVCNRKRQIDLVEAFARVADLVPQLVIIVAGPEEPVYAAQMKERIRALPTSIQERIIRFPARDDVRGLYAAADFLVSASADESYPRSLLEAMAFGLPILTTPVGGVPEQVQKGVNSAFFQPGSINELATYLVRFSRSAGLRQRYGAASAVHYQTLNTTTDTARELWTIMREATFTRPLPSRIAQLAARMFEG